MASTRDHLGLSTRNLLIGLIAGSIGLVINLLPVPLFPGLYLALGSSVIIVASVHFGPLAGCVSGLIAGLYLVRDLEAPYSLVALLLGGQGLWVGLISRRKPQWRPLYIALGYWLIPCGLALYYLYHHVYRISLVKTGAEVLRSIVDGIICALLAETVLIVLAYIMHRKGYRKKIFHLSFSGTIGLVLMLGTCLLATVAAVSFARYTRSEMISEAQNYNSSTKAYVRSAVSLYIDNYRAAIELVADIIEAEGIDIDETARLSPIIETAQKRHSELAAIFVADPMSHIRASSPAVDGYGQPLIGQHLGKSIPDFQPAGSQAMIFDVELEGRGTSVPTSAIVRPLYSKNRELMGFVVGRFNMDHFYSIANSSASNSGGRVVITDKAGNLVADSELSPLNHTRIHNLREDPIYRNTIGIPDGSDEVTISGQKIMRAWSSLQDHNWKVLVLRPMQSIEEEIELFHLQLLAVLLAFMLGTALVAHYIGKILARPLVILESSALKLAEGDLAARPDPSYIITREVVSLTQTFTKMAVSLENAWEEQKALTVQAEHAATEAQNRAGDITSLNAVGQELASTFDLPSICRAAYRYVRTQVEASTFMISLYDESSQRITCAFALSDGREYDVTNFPPLSLGESMHSRCIRYRTPLIVDDLEEANKGAVTHYIGEDPRKSHAALYLPLIAFDRVVGTLQVQSYTKGRYTAEHVEKLMPVTSQIAIAINNARLFEQVARAKVEWETTFDSMSDGVFVFDENGHLVRVNRAGSEMEGVAASSLVQKRCCEMYFCVTEQHCLVTEALVSGKRIVQEGTPTNNASPLLIAVEPLRIGEQILGAVCVARDLSDLRRAEEEARTQRELTARLVEFAQEAIYATDLEGRTTWFNRRLCDLTGYTAEDLLHKDFSALVHQEDVVEMRRLLTKALTGTPVVDEARFIRRDGEVRWYKASYTPVTAQGKVTGALAVARDITDERRTAEEMQRTNKLAAVGQLAAGIAHDFNNLLSIILGRAQLLKRQGAGESMRRSIELIEKAALDGAATVRRLQNFARRKVEEAMEPVMVDEILRDVVALTRMRWRDDAQARGIVYEVRLQLGAPATVMGSPSELREVFTNLVINALDAMPEGGRLTIESDTKGGRVFLRVLDTGIGMSEEVRQHIFEPFYTTKGHAGTGLGLAVSYGIVERHGGTIEVQSELGRGTVFTVILPLAKSSVVRTAQQPTVVAQSVSALVIDDDDFVRETLVDMLNELGHKVERAANGREGLQMLEVGKYDVVLTDLSMPDMDGWTVARHVRMLRPHVKILLVTGYGATVELTGEAADLADGVIGKPFVFDDIASTLERVMRQRRPLQT
jgi:PAS domain S-box-containing protein